ncbi:protein starmaker isoform X2 [Fundulus heteroclitus]|uniref:protein starmaker isoform X2 n=1 Tax=Fundulus heteroclitus TaxID=8078 RepID=UPI00165C5837|nr:protein starmaker isoform X2 [Fundulus heteroclitus]
MAATGDNLLSVEHLTIMEQNTFTKQRELFLKKRGVQLRQHLRELKERERKARQHNRQLLLQFERAQDTLRDMLARNAAMKTIRMEYERYLKENSPRWQQQLQEKTQASQKKRMEDCLKSYLQHHKDPVPTATVDDPLISQDAYLRSPKYDAPQMNPMVDSSAYGPDDSSLHPHLESSWLTQPGFLRAPFQPQSSPLFPPINFPYSHPLLPQHLTSPLADHQPWTGPEAAGRAPPRYSDPCADGTPRRSSGQLHSEEPSASTVCPVLEREHEPSTVISKRVRGGGGGRCLSPELDVKPVRLSGGHAESSESGRASSLTSREKKRREKKGRTKASSSESEKCGSEKLSSKLVAASCAVALGSETNSSAEEGGPTSRRRTKRGVGLNVGSPPSKKEVEEPNRSEDEKADSLSEQAKSPGPDNGSESCRGEEGSDSDVMKSQTRDEETDDEEDHSSEQSVAEERDEEEGKKKTGSGDEKRGNKAKSEEDSNVEEDEEESSDDVPPSRNGKELEAEDRVEDEEEEDEERSDKLENEDGENRNEDAASSQEEEEESEGREKTGEEQEGSNQDEDQLGSDEAGDSEDSIISPQENRSKQMKNNPEEAAEDEEEESDAESSNNNSKESSDEEDIENLLAPQEPTNKKENAVKSPGKPKAACLDLGIFQVTEHTAKTDHQSDSDEFDHFYD